MHLCRTNARNYSPTSTLYAEILSFIFPSSVCNVGHELDFQTYVLLKVQNNRKGFCKFYAQYVKIERPILVFENQHYIFWNTHFQK